MSHRLTGSLKRGDCASLLAEPNKLRVQGTILEPPDKSHCQLKPNSQTCSETQMQSVLQPLFTPRPGCGVARQCPWAQRSGPVRSVWLAQTPTHGCRAPQQMELRGGNVVGGHSGLSGILGNPGGERQVRGSQLGAPRSAPSAPSRASGALGPAVPLPSSSRPPPGRGRKSGGRAPPPSPAPGDNRQLPS